MSDHERDYTPEQKITIEEKINRAIDDDTPDMYVQRSDGRLEKGWLPYDVTVESDPKNPDFGEQIVHFAKPKDNPEDGYDLKSMYGVDVERVNTEAEAIETETEHLPGAERVDRARAIRMSGTFRRMQERFGDAQ